MPGRSRKGGSIDLNGYRKDRTIEVSGEMSLLLTAGSFVLFFVSAAAVLLVYTLVTGTDSFTFTASGPTDLMPILVLVPLNTAGSAADLYAAATLLRSPAESLVLEEGGAMTLFVPE